MHTPGPWTIDNITTRCGGPRIDAKLPGRPGQLGLADLWDVGGYSGSTEANARLMAEAPNLLEAARIVEAHCEREWIVTGGIEDEPINRVRTILLDTARAAIAKATGLDVVLRGSS